MFLELTGSLHGLLELPKMHIAETGFPEAFPVVLRGAGFMAFPGTRNRAAVNRPVADGVIFDHSFLPVTSSGTTAEE